jgi:uncharacterized protein
MNVRLAREASAVALENVVHGTPWLCEVLQIVRDAGPPGAFVAAGAVRDTVWDALTGRISTGPRGDIDVVYWDNAEPEDASRQHEMRLRGAKPEFDWEVTNQATVHSWLEQAHGLVIVAHQSVAHGLSTWPETATAVGIRLTGEGKLDVLAPLGLKDLFELCLRHNPAQAGPEIFWHRLETKRWMQRWPELKLVIPSGGESIREALREDQ